MKITKLLPILILTFLSQTVYAAFPDDFDDVVWVDADISSFEETSVLDARVSGGTITVSHSKRNSWPLTRRFSSSENVNANVWGCVQLNEIWHCGTWEFLRRGVTTRSTSAFGGRGHFRSPIGTFRPRNGEIYGFMVSGVHRDGFTPINVRERSNVVLWKWGEGVVDSLPGADTPNVITPATNLLLDE